MILDFQLNEKELEILRLYAHGLTINQIAERIFVSSDTVEYYKQKNFDAFGVKNFTEASSFAIDKII